MIDTAVRLTLPWPDTRLSPNSRVHRTIKAAAVMVARNDAYYITKEADQPLPDGDLQMTVVWYPPDKRKRDDDNVLASLKPYRDGIFRAYDADDSRVKRTIIERGWIVKNGAIEITIERRVEDVLDAI
jgi:crossover junction endodeoxyribonuclease RusA